MKKVFSILVLSLLLSAQAFAEIKPVTGGMGSSRVWALQKAQINANDSELEGQEVISGAVVNNILTLTKADGTTFDVSFNDLVSTDTQTITAFSLNSSTNILTLTLSGGSTATVDLSALAGSGGLLSIDELPGDTVDNSLIDSTLLDADLTYLAGFTPTANIKTILNTSDYAAIRAVLGYGSAANRAAEDTMTDGSNLPDGAAIKAYGDANWGTGGGVEDGTAGVKAVYYWDGAAAGWSATLGLFDDSSTTAADLGLSALEISTRLATKALNLLTGYTSGAGTVAGTDTVLQAIQKLNGNDGLKAPAADAVLTSSTQLPNGANPTTDAAGEIAVDTSTGAGQGIRAYGAVGFTLPAYQTKCTTINAAAAASDFMVERLPYAITIRAAHVTQLGATNVIGHFDECDANGGSCATIDSTADITATSSTANDDGTLSNPSIDSGDVISWHTTSVSGTNTQLMVCIDFTVDQVN